MLSNPVRDERFVNCFTFDLRLLDRCLWHCREPFRCKVRAAVIVICHRERLPDFGRQYVLPSQFVITDQPRSESAKKHDGRRNDKEDTRTESHVPKFFSPTKQCSEA